MVSSFYGRVAANLANAAKFSAFALCAWAGLGSCGAPAAIFSWNTDNGSWNTPGNWTPGGGPPDGADTALIGNTVAAENAFLNLNINATVTAMTISDGMVLNGNGSRMIVNGDLLITGRNEDLINNVTWPSRIQVKDSAFVTDFDVNNLTVEDEASVEVWEGATLKIDNVLTVAAGSGVGAEGTINFFGNESRVYINDGGLGVGSEGLVINQNGDGLLDLDGNSGNGRVSMSLSSNITMNHANLTINGTALADSFSGEMNITGGGFLTMNLSSGAWTADSSSQITFFSDSIHPGDSAKINGADVTFGGKLDIFGIAEINAKSRFNGTAVAELRNGDELRLDDDATFAGGSFIQAAATTGGIVTNNGGLTVESSTTINLPTGVFDWDGDAASANTSVHAGVTFTVNVDTVDNDGVGDPYEATTNVGIGATLAVNTTAAWGLAGSVNLQNANLTGSGVSIKPNGIISGTGSVNVASIDNSGRIAAGAGTLTVQATGTNDLDGTSENGRLYTGIGNLTVQGINFQFPFDGELHIGSLGLPGTYYMPTGGLSNGGLIEMNGGVYDAGFRQDGQLTVLASSRIKSSGGRFGNLGTNTINAELRLDGTFVVENGAVFNGSGKVTVMSASELNGEHMATVALLVDNAGRVEPGTSPGIFNVADFTNQTTGTLGIELLSSGGVLGIDHDLLDVRGTAILLGGTLDVSFLNGFTPQLGDSFLVVRTLLGVQGTFDTLIQPAVPGIMLQAVYDANTVRLVTMVPEGSAAMLAAVGGIGMFVAACRKRRG
jgi:hypothetical protein